MMRTGQGSPRGQAPRTGSKAPAAGLGGVLVLALAVAPAGCDSSAFAPPPPPELSALPDPNRVAPSATIDMILAPVVSADRDTWETAARQEAGRTKAILSVSRPAPGSSPSQQADLIRKTAKRGPSALIVDPVDDPAVTEALREVRAGGTPVVVIGRRVEARDPAAPIASVDYAPFRPAAEALVKALLDDARTSGIPADSHALIAYCTKTGPESAPRARALEDELKKAGVTHVETVTFPGDYEEGAKVLTARVEADPKVGLLVAVEDTALSSALSVLDRFKTGRNLCVVGGTTLDRTGSASAITGPAMMFDRNVPALARQAMRLAADLARGATVARHDVEIPLPLHGRAAIDSRYIGPPRAEEQSVLERLERMRQQQLKQNREPKDK